MICKKCNNEFEPLYFNGILRSKFCIPCLSIKGKAKLKTINNKEKSEAKEKLKTHKDYLKDLQKIFNSYIRIRDKNESCISCKCTYSEVWHASHYYPTTKSYLRFNEDNVHKSCLRCNMFLSGNLTEYRKMLIEKIGIERVELLDLHVNDKLDLSKEQIIEKILYYKSKIK